MKTIIIILIAVLALNFTRMSFYTKKKNRSLIYENRITLTGNTRNIEGQAAIVSDSVGVYYVDGMGEWEKDWLHQTVRITGDLERKDEMERGIAQHDPGKVIKSAVVMLLHREEGYEY
jgi:hypothetical protein